MTDSNELPPSRRRRDKSLPAPAALPGDPPPVSLSEAIEHERTELMQVQAMLKCLYEVLLYADDDDSIMHADVANICARLIDESVARLDAVRLRTLRDAASSDAKPASPPPYQVRDDSPVYLC